MNSNDKNLKDISFEELESIVYQMEEESQFDVEKSDSKDFDFKIIKKYG